MKVIKKIGYGLLSIITLFFYSVTNGLPYGKIFNPFKEKVLKIQKDSFANPESLVLEPPDSLNGDDYPSHTSHRSHSSHRSHASHRSGTTGTVRTAPERKTGQTTTPIYVTSFAQYLTIADVEKVTGFSGIEQKLEPSVLHFFRNDGREVLQVRFWNKEYFSTFANDNKYSPLSGIGEKALLGTPQLPIVLIFAKGRHCVEISTFPEEGLKLFLSLDQLKTIANYIASRLTD